jgi:poly-gamma-glutamate biosynthesis protein PgsC/CapC
MTELLPLSIGIGLAVNLIFSEAFGLAAGGMVVPGYIALYLHRPLDVVLTLAAGLMTFVVVRGLSNFLIIYGRRRTVLMVLVGFLLGALFQAVMSMGFLPALAPREFTVIGYIIPGLIGIWLDRQGIVETLTTLLTAAVVVRLLLILFIGSEVAAL